LVSGPADLTRALETLLGDDQERARRQAAALEAVTAIGGAARRITQRLRALDLWPVTR
jgi:hypothetical protein